MLCIAIVVLINIFMVVINRWVFTQDRGVFFLILAGLDSNVERGDCDQRCYYKSKLIKITYDCARFL